MPSMAATEDAPAMNNTVFDAFPNAIENWQIAEMSYSTIRGNVITGEWADIGVIVDEGSSSDPNQSPNYANAMSDLLIYCKPYELPSKKTEALIAAYAVQDPDGVVYSIIDAGIGKNQETGVIEHIELKLRQMDMES